MTIHEIQLQAFLTDVEKRVLGAFATHSFRAAADTSFARGLLRETMQALSPTIAGAIVWLAFSAEPYLADSWFVAGAREVHERQLPLQVIAPEAIATRVRNTVTVKDKQGDASVTPGFSTLDVSASERRVWPLAAEAADFYIRPVALHYYAKNLTALRGALIAATTQPLGADLSELDDALDHSLACIVDRLRLAQAADSASMRVLASLDDEYQGELIRARQVSGLQEFLSDLQEGSTGLVPRETAPRTAHEARAKSSDGQAAYAQSSACKAAFRSAINDLEPLGEKTIGQLRLALADDQLLQTPIGRWYGWAEYRYGLADLRLRPVVMEVVSDLDELNGAIARFVAAARGRRADTGLVILTPEAVYADVDKILGAWRQVINVAAGVLPITSE